MKKPPIIWTNLILFTSTALVAGIGIPWYAMTHGFDFSHLILTIISLSFCELSITAGYHRLWSHKSYETHPVVEFIYAIGGAFALQNSILHWASDHRTHHRFVDDHHKDPYSAKRGLWFSHIGWMLREYQTNPSQAYANARDLQKNKVVMWQHRHYLSLTMITNIGIPLGIGILHGDILGILLTVGVLRLVLSHHFTFLINSLAHYWGSQPYTDKNSSRDNGFLALLTFGEGYHNFHHIFEFDYRNGVRWWQFDPTKWLIASLCFFGAAKNLRRTTEAQIEKAKLAMRLKRIEQGIALRPNPQEMLAKMREEYNNLLEHFHAYYEAKTA